MPDNRELSVGACKARVQLTGAAEVFGKRSWLDEDDGIELEPPRVLGSEKPKGPCLVCISAGPDVKAVALATPASAPKFADHAAWIDCDNRGCVSSAYFFVCRGRGRLDSPLNIGVGTK